MSSKSDHGENYVRPGLRVRRFGRSDFQRFDQEAARGSHLCVGSGNIGKVEVECKYHWRRARWGVLGPNQNPAGIVYIDISFKQPPEHMLSHANVLITLSEDVPNGYKISPSRRRPFRPSLDSEHAVQVTEFFGPHSISGPPSISLETSERSFQPTLGAGGFFEVGGMGTRRNLMRQYVDSWTFKGTQRRAKDGVGLRCLEWELKENETKRQPLYNHMFQTAFAFEHSGRLVNMRVEIEGRLRSRMRQGKQRFLRFCSRTGDNDNAMVTQIDLSSAPTDFQTRLDELAFGLNMDMQRRNLEAIPVEMPGPTQASFEPVPSAIISGIQPDEATLNDSSEAQDASIDELEQFLQQTITGQPVTTISQQEHSSHITRSEETIAVDGQSHSIIPKESTISKQIAWRFPEIVVLALIKWLVLVLKAMGTEQADLAAIPVTLAESVKKHADAERHTVIDRLRSEIRSGQRLKAAPDENQSDASTTLASLTNGSLVFDRSSRKSPKVEEMLEFQVGRREEKLKRDLKKNRWDSD